MGMETGKPPGVVDREPPSRVSTSLFRHEVLAERQTQWLGTVLMVPRISHSAFTAFALLMAGSVLALLFFADYTRKAHIAGWLVPQHGLARIVTPQPGVVTQVFVHEGMTVPRANRCWSSRPNCGARRAAPCRRRSYSGSSAAAIA